MAQFAVYRNKNSGSRDAIPFLLNVQHDLLEGLETRVVIPLGRSERLTERAIRTLMPVLEIEGERLVLLTPQLAGIPKSELGPWVAQLDSYRSEVIAALDLLVTGL